jgi:hypothetical protein
MASTLLEPLDMGRLTNEQPMKKKELFTHVYPQMVCLQVLIHYG